MQISTNTVIVHWKQWWGKTIFSVLLSCDYHRERIFWNVEIEQHWQNINKTISNLSNLSLFRYEKHPGIIIFDEMGLNFNSKNHSSEKNKTLSSFFFLVRKFNLSSIFISQRFGSVPVDMRELADYIFEISSIHRKWTYPLFRITRQSVTWEWILRNEWERIFDIIKYLQIHNISYNTLESSIIS